MAFNAYAAARARPAPILSRPILSRFALPSRADTAMLALAAGAAALVACGVQQMQQPLGALAAAPVQLDPQRLPGYALLTALRMFAALVASLLLTLVVGTLAARNRRAEKLLVPLMDILQSVPVLGFLTFTVTLFMGLFPGSRLGVEFAAIFAVFTAQVWNMAFGFYQSLTTLSPELEEVCGQFGLSSWRRFLRLELPAATPGLVWNMMLSMSGGWFFVVASEAITVGNTVVTLPGIGAWLALAIARHDAGAVAWAVAAMAAVILLYDRLLFRPLLAFADRFRLDQAGGSAAPRSLVYDLACRARLVRGGLGLMARPLRRLEDALAARPAPSWLAAAGRWRLPDPLWAALVAAALSATALFGLHFIAAGLGWADVVHVFGLGLATLARVLVLVAVASLIWVPAGVWIGQRPVWAQRLQPAAQFLAAFPANLLFPLAVVAIAGLHLNPDIWLSPLMVLGTQWYILFNVIAGASRIPAELQDAGRVFGVQGWQWWRRIALPAIFPYYVTGALTASGGSWNASVVAEAVSWGGIRLHATGVGAYVADATERGNTHQVALGIVVMSALVVGCNLLLWRPLHRYAARHFRLD